MSTPTATPRTDDEETPLITNHRVSAETYKRMVDLARELETELARLRAELAVAENWVEHHSKHADDLIAENVKLRAEVERWQAEAEEMSAQRSHNANQAGRLRAEVEALKQSIESGQRVLREDAERNAARAERAEAALAKWSVLNTWGGTPEIIHEFIKGQQNRIHHCQDLETELNAMKAEFEKIILLAAQAADRIVELRRLAEKAEAEVANAVDGVIDGGSIPDTLLVIHIPRSPVGYRVGQPVKVILPAIDAAMKEGSK